MEVLTHLADFALTKLIQEVSFLLEVPGEVERLQNDLRMMNGFLQEAGNDQEQHLGPVHRQWVSRIREAVYDAEDIIELFILKVSLGKDFSLQKMRDRHKVGNKIESIRVEFTAILSSMGILGPRNSNASPNQYRKRLQLAERESSPDALGLVTFGLKEKEDQLVELLIKGHPRRRVISVVGPAGVGKTALVKTVYNRQQVEDGFGRGRAWVYVSLECKPKEIYQKILDQVYKPSRQEAEKMKEFDENKLADFLYEKLKGRKYLVVLDDVWHCDDLDRISKVSIQEPNSLGRVFPESRNGSRVIVTSRDENVGQRADARGALLKLEFLPRQDSEGLFLLKAFADADPNSYEPSLRRLGERMLKSCNGLPLAIEVLGGLLARDISRTKWGKVLDDMDARLMGRGQPVREILNLSYITLPSHLKLCFLYLCLFPENFVISARKLLTFWIAEGFVPQQGGNQRMRDTANGYLNELISRSLVQVVRRSVNKRVMECRIHGFIRKLAVENAKEENLIDLHSPSPSTAASYLSSTKFRWQSIDSNFDRYASVKKISNTSPLRTLLFPKLQDGANYEISNLRFIHKWFKSLRVLDLEGLKIRSLPTRIGDLIFLRYLGLRNTGLETLPTSVKDLMSLQTLETDSLKRVTKEICKIKNLRHLYMEGQAEPEPIPVDKLKNLQNLSGLRFDQWFRLERSRELTCLEKLKLEGRLVDEIQGLLSNSISQLQNLKSLYLKASEGTSISPPLVMNTWEQLCKLDIKGHMPRLPEASQFPPNLTQLTLEDTRLREDPMRILGQLPELSTLRLRSNSYIEDVLRVSPMGFTQLNVLQISELTQLTELNIDPTAMRWLKELEFYEELQIPELSFCNLQNLVEVDIIGHGLFSTTIPRVIPFHMLLQNDEWKHIPRTYRNNAKGFHFYREQSEPLEPKCWEWLKRWVSSLVGRGTQQS